MTTASALLAEALELAPETVPSDATIETFERWDSLAHVRLCILVEERLGRALETDEMLSITSLANLEAVLAAA